MVFPIQMMTSLAEKVKNLGVGSIVGQLMVPDQQGLFIIFMVGHIPWRKMVSGLREPRSLD